MSDKYAIHPDFAKLPKFSFRFNKATTTVINTAIRSQRLVAKNRLKKLIERQTVCRADGSQLNLLIFRPTEVPTPAPVLVYCHGGGFAMTFGAVHINNCARYAQEAQCIVVLMEYRLAPKMPFPAGFDDCYTALKWVQGEAKTHGFDDQRIAVGGDSAGGALAAGIAQKSRDENLTELCGQLLIYPVTDHTCSTPSATSFTDVPIWNTVSNERMWNMYIKADDTDHVPLYAAPLHGTLNDLPKTYLETAEFDPLHDEGLSYAHALEQAGVNVELNETQGTVHAFDSIVSSDITQAVLLARISFLQQAFHAPG